MRSWQSLRDLDFRSRSIAQIYGRARNRGRPAPNREIFVVAPDANPKLISRNIHNVPHGEEPIVKIIGRKAQEDEVAPGIPFPFQVGWLGVVIEQDDRTVSAKVVIAAAPSSVGASPSAGELSLPQSTTVAFVAVDQSGK